MKFIEDSGECHGWVGKQMEFSGHLKNYAEMFTWPGGWEHLFVHLQAVPVIFWMTLASVPSHKWEL